MNNIQPRYDGQFEDIEDDGQRGLFEDKQLYGDERGRAEDENRNHEYDEMPSLKTKNVKKRGKD